MNKESLKIYGILIRLRYVLLWANARRSVAGQAGYILVIMAGLSAGVLFFLLFGGVGTFATSVTSADANVAESLIRFLFTQIFASSIGLCMLMGFGYRDVFSDESLRRYPLTSKERFAARHLTSLLDVPWTLSAVMAFGLILGFCVFGGGNILIGVPVAICFILISYIYVMLFTAIVGRLMVKRSSAFIITSLGLILFMVISIALPQLLLIDPDILFNTEIFTRYTPAGAVAAIITGNSFSKIATNILLLLVWMVVGVLLLMKLDKRSKQSQSNEKSKIVWGGMLDRVGSMLSYNCGPISSKSLRYNLRSNLILFSLLTSPLFVPLFKFLFRTVPVKNPLSLSLGIIIMIAGGTAMPTAFNIFCFDNAGIKRYVLWPVSFKDSVWGLVSGSLVVRFASLLASLIAWALIYPDLATNIKAVVMVVCVSVSTTVIFNATGVWTSLWFPKRLLFDSMWNNKLSTATTFIYTASILIPFFTFMTLATTSRQETLLSLWWCPLIILAASIGYFLLTMKQVDGLLNTQKERVINAIAESK